MTEEDFCPYCEEITGFSLIAKLETLPVMGEQVEYQAHVRCCSVCNGEYAPTALEEENFRRAYAIYRRRHNLLFPEQIRATREKYGLSQRNFSRLLGWGDITVHRYEAGALPDTAYNVMLVLVDDPLNALKVFMLNRNNLAPGIAEKLKKRIQELVRNNCRAPSYGNDMCVAADELSAICVKEPGAGKFAVKAGRAPESSGVAVKGGKGKMTPSAEPVESDEERTYTVAEVFPEYVGKETQVALRAYRTREGFTQKQLADLTGIPQHHISEMENGKRSIGKERAKKLADALHCDYRQLL